MIDTSICLISCFPIGIFLEIKTMQVHNRVITNQIIPIFFPRGFSKELKNMLIQEGLDKKGECYKTSLFDLVNAAAMECATAVELRP
jgi:hypothetical protein